MLLVLNLKENCNVLNKNIRYKYEVVLIINILDWKIFK